MLTKQNIYWLFSIFLLTLTIVAKLYFLTGFVFGLDYGLFHPDGMLYSFKTLTILGYSQGDAGLEVSKFYLQNAAGGPVIAPESLTFANNSNWSIFQLRVLYPILSAPFVAVFGLWGMLVVPITSFVVLWFFTTQQMKNRMTVAIPVLIVLSSSTTISRWMFANICDPLLVGLITLYIWLLPRVLNSSKFSWFLFHVIFISSTSLTRFSLLLWVSISFFYLTKRQFYKSLSVALLGFTFFVPNLFVNFSGAILASHSTSPFYMKILLYPYSILRMHVVEIGQLFVLDRVLFFGLVITFYALFREIKTPAARKVLAITISLVLTAGLNGVLGVNFRYHLPLIPFLVSFLAGSQIRHLTLKK